MTNQTNLLTRLEASSEPDRRQADQCAAEVLVTWITTAHNVLRRFARRAGSAVAVPQTIRSSRQFVAAEGEQ